MLMVEIEEIVRERIAEKYPQHGFWGEESGMSGDRNNCWVLDPIDGTTNFIHGYNHCSVSLAFCENERPIAGAIHDVVANLTYTAALGEGAYADNRRMRCSTALFGNSLFILSGQLNDSMWAMAQDLAHRTAGMRRTGSTALDLALVAGGNADIVICGNVHFWDIAAGALLIREAGGLLVDSKGRTAFDFCKLTPPFVAGAASAFSAYVTALKKHSP